MKRAFVKSFLTVLVFLILTGFIRWEHLDLDLYVSYGVFFLIVSFLCLKFPGSRKAILSYFLISLVILNFLVGPLLDGGLPVLGFPNIFMTFIGIISGYLFSVFKSKSFKLITILSGLAIASFLYINHDKWLHYLNYGNFFGTVDEEQSISWEAYNKLGELIHAEDVNDKVVLLDFWNTGCVICFTKFPKLQKLYNHYKEDSTILIYAVNIPWERDSVGLAFNLIEKKKYTFPRYLVEKRWIQFLTSQYIRPLLS